MEQQAMTVPLEAIPIPDVTDAEHPHGPWKLVDGPQTVVLKETVVLRDPDYDTEVIILFQAIHPKEKNSAVTASNMWISRTFTSGESHFFATPHGEYRTTAVEVAGAKALFNLARRDPGCHGDD